MNSASKELRLNNIEGGATMKKYIPIPEYHDQIFGGECDTAYIAECVANGMPEEDVKHLIREFGEEVLNMFEIEER